MGKKDGTSATKESVETPAKKASEVKTNFKSKFNRVKAKLMLDKAPMFDIGNVVLNA